MWKVGRLGGSFAHLESVVPGHLVLGQVHVLGLLAVPVELVDEEADHACPREKYINNKT